MTRPMTLTFKVCDSDVKTQFWAFDLDLHSNPSQGQDRPTYYIKVVGQTVQA